MAASPLQLPPPAVDDIYNVTPRSSHAVLAGTPKLDDGEENDEKPPPLPPRRAGPLPEPTRPTSRGIPQRDVTYTRDTERVMAYMIPLPRPVGPNGHPIAVPQRYMLYLPPSPDLLKPPADGPKERKRDKCVRRWQQEVRKAKTFNGAVVSLQGLYCASVRGAVYVLSLLQRNELTFLSRLPRKSMRYLSLTYPCDDGATADEGRFGEVMEELGRNRKTARRDFWIATALLPITTAVDLAIPIFGGLSEVDLVWMVVTGRAWLAARSLSKRFVLAPGVSQQEEIGAGGHTGTGHIAQAAPVSEKAHGSKTSHGHDQEPQKKRQKQEKVEMAFRSSESMNLLSEYVQAACHRQNPQVFPGAGGSPNEVEVLRSIGWAPQLRHTADHDGDIEWQVRKTAEDLRVAATKAAKTWDKWCAKYRKDPENALRSEKEKGLLDEDDD